jgi:hypothetical protein
MPQWNVLVTVFPRKTREAMFCLPYRTCIRLLLALVLVSGMAVATAQSAHAVTSSKLTCSPCWISFGTVPVGQSKATAVVFKNSGQTVVTISSKTQSAASGVSVRGLSLPHRVAAGKSVTFQLVYAPKAAQVLKGSITYNSNAVNTPLVLHVAGTASKTSVAAGVLAANPSPVNFGSVQVGNTATQSQTVTNTGSGSVQITSVTSNGQPFSLTGISAPLTLAPGHSVTFQAQFAPRSVGTVSGGISIQSNAKNPHFWVGQTGTGTSGGGVALNPSTINFGSVTVGSTKTSSATVSASGASVTLKSAGLNSNEYAVSGLTLPITLNAGQSFTFKVTFAPKSSGTASATLSLSSSANSVQTTLQGAGTSAAQHSVNLSWKPSTSQVIGYNVYRGAKSGGPYSMVTSAPETGTSFTDTSVQGGNTYYYVVTAVNGSGNESVYSNQAAASVPSP